MRGSGRRRKATATPSRKPGGEVAGGGSADNTNFEGKREGGKVKGG